MTDKTKDMTREAAAWIARLDAGELSADDLIALRDWAKQSPAHMRELEHIGEIWRGLDSLAALRELLAKPAAPSRWTSRTVAAAAGLAVLAVAAGVLMFGRMTGEPVQMTAAYTTEIGEQTVVEPGEGSSIRLNTDSQMTVDYSPIERRVLLAHGEAFFEVESSDDRPFVVATEFGHVKVTGTAFLVRIEETGLEVIVKEGRVELHEQYVDSVGGSLLADLEAGEVAIVDNSGAAMIDEIGPEKMVRKLGWRDGMLMFDGESLDEVVREVSRYTSVNIVIETPALREKRIGGYFKVGEVEDLLGTLESDFDIEVYRVDDNHVRLAAQYN